MLLTHSPGLVRQVLSGQARLLEPLLDLMLPPLAYHVLILVALCAVPVPYARLTGLCGLAVVALHVFVAFLSGQMPFGKFLASVLWIPYYLLWKIGMLTKVLAGARSGGGWVRTERAGPEKKENQ